MSKKSKVVNGDSPSPIHSKKKERKEKKDKKEKKEKKDKLQSEPSDVKASETTAAAPKSLFDPAPKSVDEGLASLFVINSGPVNIVAPSSTQIVRPVRRAGEDDGDDLEEGEELVGDEPPVEIAAALAAREEALHADRKKKRKRNTEPEIEDVYMEKLRDEEPEVRKKQKKDIRKAAIEEEKEDVSDDGDEAMVNGDDQDEGEEEAEEEASGSESDAAEDSDVSNGEEEPQERIRHETEGDLQDKELDKANRTVFVGNLPSSIITDKSQYKTLQSAFKLHGPIESLRFRSIAFSDQIPRKAAFITKALHVDQQTVNAYIVFKSSEAARSSLKLNGTVILNHHIRVDSVAHPAKNDSRKCVFVGNLDFEAAEETLWKHFSPCGKVENVRLVRDAKTNVGKGFAYVQFEDEVCVDKALLLDGKPVQDDKRKRKLRVTRAKNMKRKAVPGAQPGAVRAKKKTGVYVPKADPRKSGMAGRAGKLLGKAGGAKARRTEETRAFEGTRAVPGMDVGLKTGGSGKKKGKPRARQTARSSQWKKKPAK
ncbi:hypothetical protein ABW19_dt0206910 [Dactylella cylindrospora]|nr:hypothetical protein ABW19_dt0206910 [Dactylella cylindrospora]